MSKEEVQLSQGAWHSVPLPGHGQQHLTSCLLQTKPGVKRAEVRPGGPGSFSVLANRQVPSTCSEAKRAARWDTRKPRQALEQLVALGPNAAACVSGDAFSALTQT
ncbi:Hypothetical predicted protein [Marmota monax]|uniref:Uncharacterized protein n=1 Tax=Marmota monax TaxID=9995 RepID=A0A5E4C756_MARMO|nr:hypothetical protein GHT09_011516 [Marmota monax]VTJ77545.1 Hypothetical predicted protein [Marmota monax]